MRLWDVNLWVYAFRSDAPRHHKVRALLEESLARQEPFIFTPHLAASFLHLVTNSRIFNEPSSLEEAWTFIDYLKNHRSSIPLEMDDMGFGVFKHLNLTSSAVGNRIPDVFLAALALRHDAKLVTCDRGFLSYSGLRAELVE